MYQKEAIFATAHGLKCKTKYPDYAIGVVSTLLHRPELPCIDAYLYFGSGGTDTRFKNDTRLLAFGPAA